MADAITREIEAQVLEQVETLTFPDICDEAPLADAKPGLGRVTYRGLALSDEELLAHEWPRSLPGDAWGECRACGALEPVSVGHASNRGHRPGCEFKAEFDRHAHDCALGLALAEYEAAGGADIRVRELLTVIERDQAVE